MPDLLLYNSMQYCYFESPFGKILLAGDRASLSLVGFPVGKMAKQPANDWQHKPESFGTCMKQLEEYFNGSRQHFGLSCALRGTEFQQNVLNCVAKIPYGETASYSAIASQINNPKAVRAVGTANANNNLPIIIPCHRVIGKNGSLTGFGGGMEIKRFLLELERNGRQVNT